MRGSIEFAVLLSLMTLTGCIVVPSPQPRETPQDPPAPVVQDYVEPVPAYQPPPPDVATVYYSDLSPYGHWVVYERYGRCWAPYNVPGGWRPYTVGHWAYTDDENCSWVSEGPESDWGGIVYHYGQWSFTPEWGWIWVPGTTWVPAWVAWREGGGYCGWAPLPPEACRGDVSYRDADRYCPADNYVYVNERDVNVTQVNQRFVTNNVTIINRTTNITNITVVNNRVINQGVPTRRIELATGRSVEHAAVTEAHSPEEARRFARTGVPVHYQSPEIERVRQTPPAIHHEAEAREATPPPERPEPVHHQPARIQADDGDRSHVPDQRSDVQRRPMEPREPPAIPNHAEQPTERQDVRQKPKGPPARNGHKPPESDKPDNN